MPGRAGGAASPLDLHVCCKATFRMEPGHAAVPVECDPELPSGDLTNPEDASLGLEYPSDFVPYKPRGEVLVAGSAVPPAGRSEPIFRARFSAGDLTKTLHIFGERKWEQSIMGIRPGLAAPGTELSLSYAHSYGGPGFAMNPIGQGRETAIMHRIELPNMPVVNPNRELPPAGFGPIPADWMPRRGLLGKYGADYAQTRWPWWPEGFDYSYFQSAPRDQQRDGFWRGDEELVFENLHPSVPNFRSALPGLRPRCFVRRDSEWSAGAPTDRPTRMNAEVAMDLDTIWANPSAEKLVLCWRGHIPIATIKFPDLYALWIQFEPLGATADITPVAEAELLALEQAQAALAAPPERSKPAPPRSSLPAGVDPSGPWPSMAELKEQALAEARRLGPKPPEPRPEDLEAVRKLEEIQAQMKPKLSSPEVAKKVEEAAKFFDGHEDMHNPAKSLEATEARIAELEAKFQKLEAELPQAPKWQTFQEEGKINTEAMRAHGLPGADCRQAPFAGLDLSLIDFAGCVFEGADLSGAKFCGSNLKNADFSGCKLTGVDFSKATMDGAVFDQTHIQDTIWDGALCGNAKFVDMDLRGVQWARFQGPGASFQGCQFENADLSDAYLVTAEFPDSNLAGANFAGAILSGADLRNCAAAGAIFSRAHVQNLRTDEKTDLTGARLDGALAEGAIFEGTKLVGARFERADLQKCRLVGVDASGAVFDKADLRKAVCEDSDFDGASFLDVNAMESVFDRSICRDARFDRSNLYDASFWETELTRCRWDGAFTPRTRLRGPN